MLKSYTEDQLLDNYNTFITFVERSFTGERLDKLLNMYSMEELGFELMMAPASSRLSYHCAYPGGYIDHVLNVANVALQMSSLFASNIKSFGINKDLDYTRDELLFAVLHHDLGKIGERDNPFYVPEDRKWHKENRGSVYTVSNDLVYMDLHHRTLFMLSKYEIRYNEKEMLGIILADGMYNDYAKAYFANIAEERALRTDLPYIIHWADHMATRIEHYEYVTAYNKY
jgi:hypothetical protein